MMIMRFSFTYCIVIATAVLAGTSPFVTAQTKSSDAAQPVARVLNTKITIRQLDMSPAEMRAAKRKFKGDEYEKEVLDQRSGKLLSLILQPLLRDYARKNAITASAKEMNLMSRAVFKQPVARGVNKTLAESNVINWKTSKKLYEQYGGAVIFQQSNPLEPVGAYQKLLELREREKAFEIYDPKLKEAFWSYFTSEHMVVPVEDINYETPWWLHKPKE